MDVKRWVRGTSELLRVPLSRPHFWSQLLRIDGRMLLFGFTLGSMVVEATDRLERPGLPIAVAECYQRRYLCLGDLTTLRGVVVLHASGFIGLAWEEGMREALELDS